MAGHRAAAASHAASRVVHAEGCGFSSTARWSAEMHERDPQGPLGDALQQPRCEDGDQDGPQREPAAAQFYHQRQQLLAATLRHVPQHGWAGGAAAAAAASELGLSPAAVGMLGSDAQLVQLFVADCNARLEQQLASMQKELGGMDTRWAGLLQGDGRVATRLGEARGASASQRLLNAMLLRLLTANWPHGRV